MSNFTNTLKEAFSTKASFFWFQKGAIIIVAISISSCISFKPNAKKTSKSLYTTFYLGEKGTQYFVKPLTLKGANKEKITVDFTFREKAKADSSTVVINSSILLNKAIESVDSIVFYSNSHLFSLDNAKVLFREKKDGQILIRTSGTTTITYLSSLFNKTEWQIKVYANSTEFQFQSTKKTNKSIPLLHSAIFELLIIE